MFHDQLGEGDSSPLRCDNNELQGTHKSRNLEPSFNTVVFPHADQRKRAVSALLTASLLARLASEKEDTRNTRLTLSSSRSVDRYSLQQLEDPLLL